MKTCTIPGASDAISLDLVVTRPANEPKAILQMVHGMAEHKERYIQMMEYLSEQGLVCVMNDLRGHGKTAASPDDLGFMDKGGWKGMVADIACVTAWCAAENISSRKVLEKSGMQLVNTEKGGLTVDGRVYDKLIYEYRPA